MYINALIHLNHIGLKSTVFGKIKSMRSFILVSSICLGACVLKASIFQPQKHMPTVHFPFVDSDFLRRFRVQYLGKLFYLFRPQNNGSFIRWGSHVVIYIEYFSSYHQLFNIGFAKNTPELSNIPQLMIGLDVHKFFSIICHFSRTTMCVIVSFFNYAAWLFFLLFEYTYYEKWSLKTHKYPFFKIWR